MIEVADGNAVYYYPSTLLRMVSLSNHHFDALGSVVALSDASGRIYPEMEKDIPYIVVKIHDEQYASDESVSLSGVEDGFDFVQ